MMGNTKKARKKNQPKQLLGSGEGEGQGAGKNQAESGLEIKLVKLNLKTLLHVTLNVQAVLTLEGGTYTCFYDNERLGEVPQNYNKQLQPRDTYFVVVCTVSQNPPSVTIRLN